MSSRFLFALILACGLAGLSGCGQKGPLYLPKIPAPIATPAAAAGKPQPPSAQSAASASTAQAQ